jgi:hypothetical protein
MIFTLITLVIVGCVFFGLSFTANDKIDDLEKQIEELSITTLQESYRMKNKIKILEEELLTNSFSEEMDLPTLSSDEKLPPIYKQIKKLYEVGFSIDQIAKSTTLKIHDVRAILSQLNLEVQHTDEGDA